MLQEYPTLVVLSNDINSDGTLADDVRRRTDAGIVLHDASLTDRLIMSGKCTHLKEGQMEAPITSAEAMRRYAVDHGVSPDHIVKDEKSITTVGQAYCVKRGIIVPGNIGRFGVVTSDYHVARSKEIFRFIFGPEFDISFIPVPSPLNRDAETAAAEVRRLKVFRDFWRGVRPGDDAAITDAMFTRFPFYQGKTWEQL